MINNILILDTETTGLSPEKGDKIIELALLLFNVKHKSILQSFSTLFPCYENKVQSINKISPELTQLKYSTEYFNYILDLIANSDAIIAHNADFDKRFVLTLPYGEIFTNKPWICTKNNFTWPVPLSRLRLQDICLAMGVNYTDAHRALQDCILLSKCFEKVEDLEYRLNKIINI